MSGIPRWAALGIAALVAAACSRGAHPREVVSQYLEASLHGKFEEARAHLTAKDRAFQAAQGVETEPRLAPWLKGLADKVTFKIKSADVKGDTATVVADVIRPNVEAMMAELFGAAFASALSGKKEASNELDQVMAEKLENKELPLVTEAQRFALVKEEGAWKIKLDLEAKARAADMMKQAEALEGRGKLVEAKTLYEDAAKLDSSNAESVKKAKDLEPRIAALRDQQAYFPNIVVSGLRVEKGSSFLGSYALLKGEVKNTGNRSLDRLELVVYLLDREGRVISERNDTVLAVPRSETAFIGLDSDFGKPLKPNYTRKLLVDLKDAPAEWSGKVDVKVAGLEFGATELADQQPAAQPATR